MNKMQEKLEICIWKKFLMKEHSLVSYGDFETMDIFRINYKKMGEFKLEEFVLEKR